MPVIEHDMLFPAEPEKVYALIRRVDEFPRYADAVQSVVPLDERTYRWTVHANGMQFHWDVAIVEEDPPRGLKWESRSGIRNTGRYRLTPARGGTRVQLTIEYHLHNRLLDKTVGRVAKPIVHHISDQAFQRIRQRLLEESRGPNDRPDPPRESL